MYIYLFYTDLILKRSLTVHRHLLIKSPRFRQWNGQAIARRASSKCLAVVGLALLVSFLTASIWMTLPMGPSVAASESSPSSEATSSSEIPKGDRSLPRSSADISSETLNRFVLAYREILALVDERADDLRRAETETESLRIQRELESEAIAKIEEAGLTWQEYVQLLSLANSDPELSERIVTQLKEL